MSSEETSVKKSLGGANIFAGGVLLGFVICFMMFIGDTKQLRALPIQYEHCSNYPGVAISCEVRARFTSSSICEDYRKHVIVSVWNGQEPDTTRTYCRESK